MLTKAKCHFLLGEDEHSIRLFKRYGELSYSSEYESDMKMMEVCSNIRKGSEREVYGRQL